MTDTANLRIRVEGQGLASVDQQLSKLDKSATNVEKSSESLTGSFRRMLGPTASTAEAVGTVDRQLLNLDKSATVTEKSTKKLTSSVDKLAAPTKSATAAIKSADKQVGRLGKTAGSVASVLTGDFRSGLTGLAAPAAVITTVLGGIAAANRAIAATAKYEVFAAQLETATGSAKRASLEFDKLQLFATTTPFHIDEVVDSFVKLTNLGLNPSQSALTSYGNTASAMGKSLNQLIEAVADAATGEFERLKEFGIKAKSQGDDVIFTFRGVQTQVKKDAESIQDYLLGLGNTQFAGSMERQADTLDTSFSNLGAATDRLLVKLASDTGLTAGVKGLTSALTDMINELSGAPRTIEAISADIEVVQAKLADSGGRQRNKLLLTTKLQELKKELLDSRVLSENADDLAKALETVEQRIQRTQDNIASIDTSGGGKTRKDKKAQSSRVRQVSEANAQLEELIAQREDLETRLAEASKAEQSGGGEGASTSVTPAIIKSLEQQIALYNETGEAAKLRYELENGMLGELNDNQKETVDSLIANLKRLEDERDGEQALESIRSSLLSEEEAVIASYVRRRDIILANTQEGSEAQKSLLLDLQAQRDEELFNASEERAWESFDVKLERINEEFEIEREAILSNTELSELEKTDLITRMAHARAAKVKDIEDEQRKTQIDGSKALLSYMDGYFKDMGSKEAAYARVAIQIGQTLLDEKKRAALESIFRNTYDAAMGAFNSMAGIPYVGPVLGALAFAGVVATGVAAAAKVAGFADGGAFDENGQVVTSPHRFTFGGGQPAVAGEAGPEGILPLRRNASGQLGVMSSGGGSSSKVINFSPSVNTVVQGSNATTAEIAAANEDAIRSSFAMLMREEMEPGGALYASSSV